MASIYWYCALAIICVGMTVFILYKKKNLYEFISFFLFAMMTAFIGEMIVLLFLKSYSYKPGVFTDYYAENIFGHIVPNASLWPATALLVVAYSLRCRWIVLITVIFTLLDILFANLGIYQHHWWKTWMTSVVIFFYCILMKIWFVQLKSKRSGILRYITFWFILLVILKLPESFLLLSGMQYAIVGWFENLYRDAGVFSVIYNAALSFLCVFFICILKKWYWKLVPFFICFSFDVILLNKGILFFNGGWNIYPDASAFRMPDTIHCT
ncbi:hypothetical protein L9W92_18265 [Pelotomaculum terephthalicicum JT]|uniref:hypothetical protein n=1 Tax=Pelotomaculum terephthalicicum TaxID=206393 RepID=UPI0009C6162C|nr:hypothetical protein [Pelotomaculum terephthalicicum]MCG9969943.1 hypothetical protein [Pelotomaculum terephthalicicum JT]OPY63747.1 MAG: hypothetical protein A4E56_00282 [Pelotomaculum sp. PtaU1.Bin065]